MGTEVRYVPRGTLDGVQLFDTDRECLAGGPFSSYEVACEEAEARERADIVPELATEVESDGWFGLAKEIRAGLLPETALERLLLIGAADSEGAASLTKALERLGEARDMRLRS
ncbi:MAG TPA: hypothetical protein VII45_03905 [Solirubrobacterales bacterium]